MTKWFSTREGQTPRLRAVIAAGIALLGVSGCGGSDRPAVAQPDASQRSQLGTATVDAAAVGDPSMGRIVFETKCQICHKLSDTEVGAGPKLTRAGLTQAMIASQVTKPRDAMPPNLVAGKDLNDVTAFLLTLQ